MGKLGLALIIVGVVVMAASQMVGAESVRTRLDTKADVGDPYLEAAKGVAAVEEIQSYVFPLADLFVDGKKVGEILGTAEKTTFYLRAVLEGGDFVKQLVAQDYRNASSQGYTFLSEVALIYALEIAVGGGVAWIAVQVILNMVSSPEGWRLTGSSETTISEASSLSAALSDIPGFIADSLWDIYKFVRTNLGPILFVAGLFVLILGVAVLVKTGA